MQTKDLFHVRPFASGSLAHQRDAVSFDPLTGMRLAPADPFTCFAEGDPPAPPPGDPPPPKTFTQDELNAIVAKRVGEVQKKFADYDDVKAKAGKADEALAKVNELTEKLELAGKSEEEKAKLLAEKLQAKSEAERIALAKERDDAKAAAERAREDLRSTRIDHQVTAVLTSAKALPEMLPYAISAFRAETKIEHDDNDRITSITFDDVPYTDAKKAAEAWLKSRPGFAAAPAGGGGTRGPNGAPPGKSFDTMSAVELATLGLEQALGGNR